MLNIKLNLSFLFRLEATVTEFLFLITGGVRVVEGYLMLTWYHILRYCDLEEC